MKGNKTFKSTMFFILSVLIIGFLAYAGTFGIENVFGTGYRVKSFNEVIKKGLDLQGGVSLVEEIQEDKVDNATIDRTIELISMRVNKLGVSETIVQREGEKRIRIEIPGVYNAKEVADTVGKTGELKFIGPDKEVILTGKDVKDATTQINPDNNKPIISLEFTDEGTKKFAEATKKFVGQQIAIYMDEEMLTNPVVNAVINDGKAIIEGSQSLEEAKRQAGIIKSGALPVVVKPVEAKTVGATLGANALPLSFKAGAVGIGLVMLFMLLFYRIPGLIANIALVLYIVLVLLTFVSIKATLTLSGIAGFLLTIGMAVDANILIFERIKEELSAGKSVRSSVESGFHRALSSIMDSNITTIIAGLVLYNLGSGAVKGFALTLIIGIVLSMLTAIVVTKSLLKLAVNIGLLNSLAAFGASSKEGETKSLKIIERTKVWVALSLVIMLSGLFFSIKSGLNFGIDFKGGTLVQINMKSEYNKEEIEGIIGKYTKDYTTNPATNASGEIHLEIRSNSLEESQIDPMFKEIKEKYKLEDKDLLSQETIGASIGKELTRKAVLALIIANIGMLIYIGFRFELKFGLAAIIALLHDVLITLAVYGILQIPINSSFIAAILTIVGYSINDTIVVFDRIRENSKRMKRVGDGEIANLSITQTLKRSVYTSLTTLITIAAVGIFVPSIRDFAIPLVIGIITGGYSSIFIASPLWVYLKNRSLAKK